METNNAPRDAAQVPAYDTAVTDQGLWIGLLWHRGPADIVAFTPYEQPIGTFENEHDAVAALWRRAHGQAVQS